MDALIMQASLREVDVAGEIAEATELRVREAGGGDHFYGAWSGGSEKSGGHPMAGSHPSGGGGGLSVEDMLRNINTSGDPFSSTPAPARDGLQSAIKSAAGGSGTLKVVRNADGTATMTGAFPALKRGETKTITSGEYSITAHRPLIGSVRMTVGGVDQADVNRMEVGGFTRDGRYASQAKVREAAAAEPDAKEPVVHICVATVKAKTLKEAGARETLAAQRALRDTSTTSLRDIARNPNHPQSEAAEQVLRQRGLSA